MARLWMACGGVIGLLAVAMAGYAAHGLPQAMEAKAVQDLRAGVQMQGWHALALIGVALWAPRGGWLADLAGTAFVLGVLLFCGAVYALALSGARVGAVAPIGGTLLMTGWLLLAASAVFARAG